MDFQREFILIAGTPIGDIQIRYYGIIIVVAMLIAATIAARLAKREGLDPDHIWGGLTWGIIPGIIMARLWFVLFPPYSLIENCGVEGATVCKDLSWMIQNIGNLTDGPLAIWSGGLSIFGALLGGLLGVYIYMRREKLDVGRWLDIAAVVLPLAQSIGRWANYVNQELYGLPTDLPWGIVIDRTHRVDPYRSEVLYTKFHPLFLYESLWSLLAFIVLYMIYRRYKEKLANGDLILMYVVQYSFIRFMLEFLRIEVAHIPGTSINSSQAITAIGFVVALGLLIYRHRPGAAEAREEAARLKAEQAKLEAKKKAAEAVPATPEGTPDVAPVAIESEAPSTEEPAPADEEADASDEEPEETPED